MSNKRNVLVVIGFTFSVLFVVIGGALLLMHFVNSSSVDTPTSSPTKQEEVTVSVTPTNTLDLSGENSGAESIENSGQQESNTTQDKEDKDMNFIYGKETVSLEGKEYKISEDSHSIVYEESGETKQLYTTEGLLKKFNIAGGYIFVIERHPTETNHYYFKRILISSGKATVLWHYISGYTMENFLISPTTFATNKLYYILFTAQSQILVLKIKDYKLAAQKSQNVEYSTIREWYKLKDKDAVSIILEQNGQLQTLQINFD